MTATTTQVHLNTTTEVVAWIAANVSKTIASAGIKGHDLTTVMDFMTTDRMLDGIRTAYTDWAAAGKDRPEGIKKIGVYLIARYYQAHNLD